MQQAKAICEMFEVPAVVLYHLGLSGDCESHGCRHWVLPASPHPQATSYQQHFPPVV